MGLSVTLLERLPQTVLTIRARTRRQDFGATLDRSINEVQAHLDRLDRECWGPPCARHRTLGGGFVDLEVGLPVAHGVPGGGRVTTDELPRGLVAGIRTGARSPVFARRMPRWKRGSRRRVP